MSQSQLPRYSHQQRIFDQTKDLKEFGLFWEQGACKTRPIIDTACHNFLNGTIDTLVVITDKGVHSQWITDEVPRWIWDNVPWMGFEYHSQKALQITFKRDYERLLNYPGLAVIAFTWDTAGDTKAGKIALWRFLKHRKCLLVADETSAIKTPDTIRTKTLLKAAPYAKMRRILNGTPIDNSPLDLYSQLRFLDNDFWKMKLNIGNYTSFKSEFCITKRCELDAGGQFQKIIGYRNLDKLRAAYQLVTDRVLKEDVMDLPPKVYSWKFFEMSREQERIYNAFKKHCMVDVGKEITCHNCKGSGEVNYGGDDLDCPVCHGGGLIHAGLMTATLPIVKLLRLQQICCGYVQADGEPVDSIPGPDNRLLALERCLESEGPFIIFSRFKQDVLKIEQLCKYLGLRVGTYAGNTDPAHRTNIRQQFQNGDLDVFNANTATCSRGITLTRARTVIYYSNYFRLGFREQSEDRVHRGGLDHKVNYIDLAIPKTIDIRIIQSLRDKKDLARLVTGDKLREWLI